MSEHSDNDRLIAASLIGGTVGSLPSIITGELVQHAPKSTRLARAFGHPAVATAGAVAGMSLAAIHSAHAHGIPIKKAVPVVLSGGSGDYLGGLAGSWIASRMVRHAIGQIKNPALRTAAIIGTAVTGDSAGGAAGSMMANTITSHILRGTGMDKQAAVLDMNAPLSAIRSATAATRSATAAGRSVTSMADRVRLHNDMARYLRGERVPSRLPNSNTHTFVMS